MIKLKTFRKGPNNLGQLPGRLQRNVVMLPNIICNVIICVRAENGFYPSTGGSLNVRGKPLFMSDNT